MTLPAIQVIDIQAQRRHLAAKIDAGIKTVLEHGRFVLGPEVQELEQRLDAWTGAHTVTVANGTDALALALWAFDVGVGDAVLIPSFSFAATAGSVAHSGATPVFVDVSEKTYNICPDSLERALAWVRGTGLRARGIIAVDLFGLPADYARLNKIAQREGLFVLSDAAQAFGGRQGNQSVGNIAEITSTSFYPTKPLSCYGDGGAVFARDPKVADKVRCLASHGQAGAKYNHAIVGTNSRLDSLQAAILLVKLEVLGEELKRRDAIAALYDKAFNGKITIPHRIAGSQSAWAHYTIRHKDRDAFGARLAGVGVMTAIHYPKSLHHQPAFARFPTLPGGCPVSEKMAAEVISLPLHPYMDEEQIQRVIEAVLKLA